MAPLTPTGQANPSIAPTPASSGIGALTTSIVVAIVCAALLGAGVMSQLTLASGTPDLVSATVQGTLCVLIAAGAGLALFGFTASRTPAAAPIALLTAATVRMLVSLSLAIAVFFLTRPPAATGTAFWVVFLLCGLAAIIAETAWGMKNLNRLTAPTMPPAPTAAPGAPETH